MVESWQHERATFTSKRISLFHENCSRQIRTPCHKSPGKRFSKGQDRRRGPVAWFSNDRRLEFRVYRILLIYVGYYMQLHISISPCHYQEMLEKNDNTVMREKE